MEKFIGFGLSGYRSFSGPVQRIAAFGKVTLLAGANNSGKSNVLSFVSDHLPKLIEKLNGNQPYNLKGLDVPQGGNRAEFTYSVPIRRDKASLDRFAETVRRGRESQITLERLVGFLSRLLAAEVFTPTQDLAWIDIHPSRGDTSLRPDNAILDTLGAQSRDGRTSVGPEAREWQAVWNFVASKTGGGLQHWVPETLGWLVRQHLTTPVVSKVPAFRQIAVGAQGQYELSGAGLYDMLAKLERPNIAEQKNKLKFQAIVDFVRRVTRVSDAMLEIPYERDTLHVTLNGRTLPVSHLGTGIHQVILLAAAATLHDDTLLCLEEPELHLHPLLQRELLRYLDRETTNQYLISTHSAHFLNTENAAVFHVQAVDGRTQVDAVKSPGEHFEICRTLGYHASDLLQSNAVIWVEGPSDRIYLLEWLRQVAPELQEGYQFSIMFYGGRLLSNLTGAEEEEEVEDFIHLRRLNRNLAVLMDSDKSSAEAPVLETKQRIVRELAGSGGVAWITAVRTIENYVPLEVWRAIAEKIHPRSTPAWDGGPFSDPFKGLPETPNKIRLAEALRDSRQLRSDLHDLPERLAELVTMIRRANPPVEAVAGM